MSSSFSWLGTYGRVTFFPLVPSSAVKLVEGPVPSGELPLSSTATPATLSVGQNVSFAGTTFHLGSEDGFISVLAGPVWALQFRAITLPTPGATAGPNSTPTPETTTPISSEAPTDVEITPTPTLSAVTNSTQNPTPTAARVWPKAASQGISQGTAAGIAVGCLLAGAFIAAFLIWIWKRRSKPRHPRPDHEKSVLPFLQKDDSSSKNDQFMGTGAPFSQLIENSLPQPLEDKAISGDVSKLSTLVKNHVQSYYHTGRVSPGILDITDLQALGGDMPISSGMLSTLLANSSTREMALRFVIAWVVVARIQSSSDPRNTFLPPEVSQLLYSLSSDNRVSPVFLNKWRVFTSTLLQSTYGNNTILPSDSRIHSIQRAMEVLEGILYPYADSRIDHERRRQNLEEILKRAAVFAFTLFSQPSTWVFDWKEEQSLKTGSLCIFPALSQVTDENGEKVKVPREFNEAIIRQLDE